MTGTVQAQSIYNSIWGTNASRAQIQWYDQNRRQLEQQRHPAPAHPGYTGSKSYNTPQGAAAADFVLVNRTDQTILAFQVEEQGQQSSYSPNWLQRPLRPGYEVAMSFRSAEHYCLIRHKMMFEGGAIRLGQVNICIATKLVVGDNGRVTFYTD